MISLLTVRFRLNENATMQLHDRAHINEENSRETCIANRQAKYRTQIIENSVKYKIEHEIQNSFKSHLFGISIEIVC